MSSKPPTKAMKIWIAGSVIPAVNPKAIKTTITSSNMECPVATSGPTIQPCRADWLTMAVETGPGETTAGIANEKENMNIPARDNGSIISDFTTLGIFGLLELAYLLT